MRYVSLKINDLRFMRSDVVKFSDKKTAPEGATRYSEEMRIEPAGCDGPVFSP